MGTPTKVLIDRREITINAGIPEEVFGDAGLIIADFPSLSILLQNIGASQIEDVDFYWSNDVVGENWSLVDAGVITAAIAINSSSLFEWGDRKNCRVRMVVTSAGGTTIRLTADVRDIATGQGLTINGNVIGGESRMHAWDGSAWQRVRAIGATLTTTLTGMLSTLPRAIYNAAPTARTEGQSGPVQAAANGSLLTSINDGTTQNNVSVATTVADAVAIALNRLRTTAVLMALNPAGTVDTLRSGATTVTATLTGLLNSLPWAVYNASPTVRTEGQGGPMQADTLGNLLTSLATLISGEDTTNNLLGILPKPTVTTSYSWTRYTSFPSGAVTANVKASAGQLFSVYCHNLNAAARYIQIHNTATTPGAGAAPVLSFLVPASGTVLIDSAFLGANGTNLSTGIAFGFSTTEATYTAGAAADCMVHIMYA